MVDKEIERKAKILYDLDESDLTYEIHTDHMHEGRRKVEWAAAAFEVRKKFFDMAYAISKVSV